MLLGGDPVHILLHKFHEVLGVLTGDKVEAKIGHISPLKRSQLGLFALQVTWPSQLGGPRLVLP